MKRSTAVLTTILFAVVWPALAAAPAIADAIVPPSDTTLVHTPTTAATTVGDIVGPSKSAGSGHAGALIAGGIGVIVVTVIAVGSIVVLRRRAKDAPDEPQSPGDAEPGVKR